MFCDIQMRPATIIFDWDNTLVDSWVCIQESYNMTFRHFGMPEWSMDETRRNVARSLRDSFPVLFGKSWEEAREVFYRSFESVHLSHLQPLPGAADMLGELSDLGVRLAVVSNKVGSYLRVEAERLGWDSRFSALIGATDAVADKPDPAPVIMVMGEAIATVDTAWFVGDSAVDMQCAVNSGCRPILLRPEPPSASEFSGYAPHCHISCCADLTALVRELPVPISGN